LNFELHRSVIVIWCILASLLQSGFSIQLIYSWWSL